MASLYPKKVSGKTYWYLREMGRVDGKPKMISERYLDQHLRNEAFALELSSRSEDFREGLKAFQEKRPPEYGGR